MMRPYLKFIIPVIALVGIAVLILIAFKATTTNDTYKLSESTPEPVKSPLHIDYKKHTNLLTESQQTRLLSDLLNKTTKNATNASAVIRDGSINHINDSEVTFIIDSNSLQSSFLINRYTDSEVDIVNIFCVPAELKIYQTDYCYET